jgi:hypothetical protein
MSLLNMQMEFAQAILSDHQPTEVQPGAYFLIYRQNREATLRATLGKIFPLIEKLVGEKYFTFLAKQYMQQYPSRTSNLQHYGEHLSRFLTQQEALKLLPYLTEVAQFEWACHQLRFAAEPPLSDFSYLETLAQQDHAAIKLNLHPASVLLQCYYPLLDIIELCSGERTGDVNLASGGLYLLILRKQFSLRLIKLTQADFIFLHQLQSGANLKTSLDKTLAVDAQFALTQKLNAWIKANIIIN